MREEEKEVLAGFARRSLALPAVPSSTVQPRASIRPPVTSTRGEGGPFRGRVVEQISPRAGDTATAAGDSGVGRTVAERLWRESRVIDMAAVSVAAVGGQASATEENQRPRARGARQAHPRATLCCSLHPLEGYCFTAQCIPDTGSYTPEQPAPSHDLSSSTSFPPHLDRQLALTHSRLGCVWVRTLEEG